MSKRYFPQQQGDRKKAKLDVSISDHNFPLSQNKDSELLDNWGDDNDDEILLLASQACEDAYNTNDVSILPDYSLCMQPGTTSTQMFPSPGPSTSNTEFTFKKPSCNPPSIVSTNLREKCNRISSPLPGILAKVTPNANEPLNNLSDDFIFNDKIYKGQDSDYVYRQLLQLQEENVKLKSENGKLLEKCVTKEGEASILRTQLKTCQVSVDNARLEKIKAQEKVQMEWTEKLAAANNQMHDLRTQLDFKNLEIISVKEKCKKLESNKLKLTQVTVGNNDISSRPNGSWAQNESMTQSRRVKTLSIAVQTEDKARFLALNKTSKPDTSNLPTLLPHILEPTTLPHSHLEYNEKLAHTDIQRTCRVYSTFHRVPTKMVAKEGKGSLQLSAVYEDIVKIASESREWEIYCNVFNAVNTVLVNILTRLETLSRRITTAFQKEMDEKYIETTSSYIDVCKEDLLKGRALHKDEQEILGRRMLGILSYVLETPSNVEMFKKYLSSESKGKYITDYLNKICSLLDTTFTATLHSGLLLSITYTVQALISFNSNKSLALEIIRNIITSRPMLFVCSQILGLVRDVSLWENFRKEFCPETSIGNLKMDCDQGVLLYKKDSCYLQILLKQTETCLKCIESQDLREKAVETIRHLVILHSNLNYGNTSLAHDKSRCDCQLVLVQVIVYALRICAVMLRNSKTVSNASPGNQDLLSTCRCGVQMLYQCMLKDVEFGSQLAHNEGHLVEFCEIMQDYEHSEVHANMLSELVGTLQSTPEDMPSSFHRQPWLKSFESFSMVD